MADVLIIDDDQEVCRILSKIVQGLEHSVMYVHSIKDGLEQITSHLFDVVLLDVQLPDGNGLDLLPKIHESRHAPEVIIMTGDGDADGAQIAIENGAWDYLHKPLNREKIMLPLNRVLQYRENLRSVRQTQAIPSPFKFDGYVGKSRRTNELFALLAQASETNANVLITGETGTGKELFSRAVHYNSKRADRDLVVVDCASLPETLLQSSLFGHEKGAFTGADRTSAGLVAQANGGSLFLDEIGELSLPVQKTFLRVLQERQYRPVGGKFEKTSDFRLIAATNRNLEQMVEEGLFRADLFYRLRTFSIYLPPLRDCQEDIRELIVYQANKICLNCGISAKGFAPDFFDTLAAYSWPGNIRELFHALEVSIMNAYHEPILFAKHIQQDIRIQVARSAVPRQTEQAAEQQPAMQGTPSEEFPTFKQHRETIMSRTEKEYCQELMKQARGDIKLACTISGLGRSRLYNLLQKHNLSRFSQDT